MAEKYVRFVTGKKDSVTGNYQGFFQSAYVLKRSGRLSTSDQSALEEALSWFSDYLEAPDRFARSSNRRAHGKALSWFKPSAVGHITKSRLILEILERNGLQVSMLTTMRPGYIIFEDEFQIAAVPFKDTAS